MSSVLYIDNDGTTHLVLDDGEYDFYIDKITHSLMCKRYDKYWREFLGDKAIIALFNYATQRPA